MFIINHYLCWLIFDLLCLFVWSMFLLSNYKKLGLSLNSWAAFARIIYTAVPLSFKTMDALFITLRSRICRAKLKSRCCLGVGSQIKMNLLQGNALRFKPQFRKVINKLGLA